ncbi:MAG TPA: type 4a pilus biogenesis protein PilO [Patescibacteria group bacterium]|nr:type 4a pilus biogenesis protein PilO [Patescibacteria group bacterium]
MIEGLDQITKYKNTIINVALVVLALFLSFRIYDAQNKKIAALKEKATSEEKKNVVLEEITAIDQKISALKKTVNGKDMNTSLNTIAAVAKENSVRIISIRPAEQATFNLYTKYPFELMVSVDSYHALGKFISKLESHPSVFSVDLLEMKPQEFLQGEKLVEKLTVKMTISTLLFQN